MRAAALIALITLFAYTAAAEQPASAVDEPVGLVVYTALGDSVTWQNQYVAGYAAHTEADLHTSVTLTNLGQPGWMSPTLLTALQTNQTFRGAVASADLITIFIGLNDYQWMRAQYLDPGSPWCQQKETCMQTMVDNFHAHLGTILGEIRSLNGSSDTAIRMMTIYNPYVAQDVAAGNFDYFDGFLQQMNATIEAEAADGVGVADIHHVFNGSAGDEDATALGFFNPPDGLHPNAAGHQRIADEFRALGYSELDADGDGMLDIETDSDGDGCADVEELGTNPLFGGERDPSNPWDFYDVTGNEKVDGMDIGLVRANFTPHGPVAADDTMYDRSPGSSMWAPGPADNRINAIDIALVRASFWHSCAAPS